MILCSVILNPFVGLILIAISSYYVGIAILTLGAGIFFDILYGVPNVDAGIFSYVYTIVGASLYAVIEIVTRRVRK